MADNVTLPGTAEVIASDDVGGAQYQIVKQAYGANNSVTQVDSENPLPVANQGNQQTNLLFRFLSDDGTTSGTKNAVGNYAGAAEEFYIEPSAGQVYHIARMIVFIEDTSGFTADEYGNTAAALTNGVKLQVRTGSHAAPTTVLDLMDGEAVTTNAEWGAHNYDVTLKSWGAGNEYLLARWTFSATGGALRLDGDSGERLAVILEDDCTGLIAHEFQVQGYIVT